MNIFQLPCEYDLFTKIGSISNSLCNIRIFMRNAFSPLKMEIKIIKSLKKCKYLNFFVPSLQDDITGTGNEPCHFVYISGDVNLERLADKYKTREILCRNTQFNFTNIFYLQNHYTDNVYSMGLGFPVQVCKMILPPEPEMKTKWAGLITVYVGQHQLKKLWKT